MALPSTGQHEMNYQLITPIELEYVKNRIKSEIKPLPRVATSLGLT